MKTRMLSIDIFINSTKTKVLQTGFTIVFLVWCNAEIAPSLKIEGNQHFLMTRKVFESLDCCAKDKTTSLYLHYFTVLGENNDLSVNVEILNFGFCCWTAGVI